MNYYSKPLDWRQSIIEQCSVESPGVVLLDVTNRLTSCGNNNIPSARSTCPNTIANVARDEAVINTPSCSARQAIEGFAVGKENMINKPLTTLCKHKKNTTFLKKRNNQNETRPVRDEEPSFGIGHNRSTSQNLYRKSQDGELRSFKRLSQLMP